MNKKLIASGRLQNRSATTKQISIHIKNSMLEWIENNCAGNKQLTLNYLLQKGIESVESSEETIIIEELE
jgi:hypothetical protein